MHKCQICGKEFERRAGGNKYCRECGSGTERSHRYERIHPSKCLNCGKAITRRAKLCHLCDNKSREQLKGEKSKSWKGGRYKTSTGYISIKADRPGKKSRNQLEHIVVWEKVNGKQLPDGWIIHHLNGIRDDNRIENLSAMPRKQHNARLQYEPYKQRIRQLEAQLSK